MSDDEWEGFYTLGYFVRKAWAFFTGGVGGYVVLALIGALFYLFLSYQKIDLGDVPISALVFSVFAGMFIGPLGLFLMNFVCALADVFSLAILGKIYGNVDPKKITHQILNLLINIAMIGVVSILSFFGDSEAPFIP